MKRLGLFMCGMAALWGGCTKEDMSSPDSGGPGYSSQQRTVLSDTIAFDGVWTITSVDVDNNDITAGFSDLYFLFDRNGTVRVITYNADTLIGSWWYNPGLVKTSFHLEFTGGTAISTLNGDYQTEVISDHQFRLFWEIESREEADRYKRIEFRKRMSI